MAEPVKQEESRNPDGTFVKGVSGNPNGRPKGKSIKELVREWLDENPDDMMEFVKFFVKRDRRLAWTMLEGSPQQKTDVTSGGKPLPILGDVSKNNSNKQDSPDGEEAEGSAGGNECV